MKPPEPDESARADWQGDFRTDVEVRDKFDLRVDEVEDVGGDDTGPMPSELLLASVASCMCLAVSFAADKRDVELPDLSVTADGYHEEGAFRFERIEVTVTSSLAADRLEDLIQPARKFCYVSNTLKDGCELEYRAESTD